jgi:hypothetical protein
MIMLVSTLWKLYDMVLTARMKVCARVDPSRLNYAQSLCQDDGATLDDIREAVAICEDVDRRARRVLGSAHPLAKDASGCLEHARYDLANFKPK